MVDEAVEALQRVLPRLGDRTRAVGRPGRVAEVDDRLVGQLVEDRPGHGEPTEPGVEDPDRSVGHPRRIGRPTLRGRISAPSAWSQRARRQGTTSSRKARRKRASSSSPSCGAWKRTAYSGDLPEPPLEVEQLDHVVVEVGACRRARRRPTAARRPRAPRRRCAGRARAARPAATPSRRVPDRPAARGRSRCAARRAWVPTGRDPRAPARRVRRTDGRAGQLRPLRRSAARTASPNGPAVHAVQARQQNGELGPPTAGPGVQGRVRSGGRLGVQGPQGAGDQGPLVVVGILPRPRLALQVGRDGQQVVRPARRRPRAGSASGATVGTTTWWPRAASSRAAAYVSRSSSSRPSAVTSSAVTNQRGRCLPAADPVVPRRRRRGQEGRRDDPASQCSRTTPGRPRRRGPPARSAYGLSGTGRGP